MTDQPILETKHLILRPFSLSDAERVRKLASAREIAENTATLPAPIRERNGRRMDKHSRRAI
jgi:hypothetical protein